MFVALPLFVSGGGHATAMTVGAIVPQIEKNARQKHCA